MYDSPFMAKGSLVASASSVGLKGGEGVVGALALDREMKLETRRIRVPGVKL